MDEILITPSDFAVVASNINPETSREELKEWLTKEHGAKDIVEIIKCYDIKHIIDLIRQQKQAEDVCAYLYTYKKNMLSRGRSENYRPEGEDFQENDDQDQEFRNTVTKLDEVDIPPKKTCC